MSTITKGDPYSLERGPAETWGGGFCWTSHGRTIHICGDDRRTYCGQNATSRATANEVIWYGTCKKCAGSALAIMCRETAR